MNKIAKKIFASTLFFATIFLGTFRFASAVDLNPMHIGQWVAEKIGNALGYYFTSGLLLVGFFLKVLASIFFAVSAYMFGIIFQLNMKMLDPSSITYSFISTGWTIVRDVANLGFVLFIILIALATIVRYRDYEAKKVLPRLIAAAILVNFSLAIPTVFINFSNIITNYFLNGFKVAPVCVALGIGDPLLTQTCSLTNYMGGVIAPQKVDLAPDISTESITGILGSLSGFNQAESFVKGFMESASVTFTLYLGILVYLMGIFVMICYAILFLIRFITLHFLLVLAPITWLFWIIPGTQGMFSGWWKKFIQYVFFAPVAVFFLYLVIKIGNEGSIFKITPNDQEVATYVNFIAFPAAMLQGLVKMYVIAFVMMGFLIGGLFASQKLAITGASGMMKLASDTGRKAKAWAQKKTAEGGKTALGSRSGLKFANQLTKNKLTAPLGNYLAKVGGKEYAKTAKEREATVKALIAAGIKPADISKGFYKPESDAALNRTIANTGKPIDEELTKKDKAFKDANKNWENYKKNEGELTDNEKEYENDSAKLKALKAERDKLKRQNVKDDDARMKDINAKIDEQKSVVDASRSAYERGRDLEYNKNEAQKAYDKAVADFEEFEEHFLDGFTDAQKQTWKNSNFDLSKTPFAGGARLRDQQVPDVSLGGIEKEIKRLESVIESAGKKLSNPKLSDGERKLNEQLRDKAGTDHEKLSTARNKLEEGKTNHRVATNKLEELKNTHGGYENIPESKKQEVWGEIQKAETQIKEAKRDISLLRTPTFMKKVKGEKEKSEKEPKPSKPVTPSKAPEEDEEEEEDE